MISELKRKSLPEIARLVGLDSGQSLHHFLTNSPWSVKQLREKRIELILKALRGRKIYLIIDETGDPKKGQSTDYVKRQYLGRLGKVDNGIVAITAYGLLEEITFPITFDIYKPKERLKAGDRYGTKPQIAGQMIREIRGMGFDIKLVLADSLYGESNSTFISCLQELKINFIVAIRSNHGVWLPREKRVRYNKWRTFKGIFSDGKQENRYIREVILGKKGKLRYWEITTDSQTMPDNSTWYVMSQIPGVKYHQIGNLYGCRTWIEYGFRQCKNELGWADFRLTSYPQIEKWWEIVFSAYLMVSLYGEQFEKIEVSSCHSTAVNIINKFRKHYRWHDHNDWKTLLNNLRLIIQPFICFNLILAWLNVFPIPQLSLGFPRLIALMNLFPCAVPISPNDAFLYFSSA
jgi:SRSO17 transposase